MGELWHVYCVECGENWLRYNGTALYFLGKGPCNKLRKNVVFVRIVMFLNNYIHKTNYSCNVTGNICTDLNEHGSQCFSQISE